MIDQHLQKNITSNIESLLSELKNAENRIEACENAFDKMEKAETI